MPCSVPLFSPAARGAYNPFSIRSHDLWRLPLQGNAKRERELYEQYKDDILFMGISSFEDYPLDARNPFSPRIDEE